MTTPNRARVLAASVDCNSSGRIAHIEMLLKQYANERLEELGRAFDYCDGVVPVMAKKIDGIDPVIGKRLAEEIRSLKEDVK